MLCAVTPDPAGYMSSCDVASMAARAAAHAAELSFLWHSAL
jgi:hypothetical protein